MISDRRNVGNAAAVGKADTLAAACCGDGLATSAPAVTVTTPCCGTTEAATAADACCDPDAKTAAVKVGTRCCG